MRNDLSNTAPTTWSISETDQLQAALDALSAAENANEYRGAVLRLGKGTYDCDLTVHNPFVRIQGEGEMTEILGKVTVYAPNTQLNDLCIRGAGKPYALRVMRNPAAGYSNVAHCRFRNLFLGATYEGAGDGPVNALEIDGVYLTDFNHCTMAFATGQGMLVDSTDNNYPSTTLDFNHCSWVANAERGAWLKGSLGIARFHGGNFEQNDLYEVQMESVNNIRFDSVDFETDMPLDAVIQASTSNPVTIENCSFFSVANNPFKPTLVILAQSCSGVSVVRNRFASFNGGRVGFIDDRSVRSCAHSNLFTGAVDIGNGTDQWIEVVRT